MIPSPDNRAPTLTLDEIERLLEKAYPGPWTYGPNQEIRAGEDRDGDPVVIGLLGKPSNLSGTCSVVRGPHMGSNGALIVALVADARARVAAGKAGGG